MLFNSISFLIFFPIVTLLYFLLPHKLRWIWLLITSYYFYMSWNPQYALLMATSTLLTYLSGLLIAHSNKIQDEKKRIFRRKLWVALSFSSNLAILLFFKYFSFIIVNINKIIGIVGLQALTPSFDVLLPVGISFYTFQALSYTIDVYRGEIEAERNFFKYALFVSFFPQLVAGPIERSKNLLLQVHERHYFDYDRMKNGLLLMLWGYFQKLVIADRVAILVNQVYNHYSDYGRVPLILATLLFAVQIYCDFSGYSDIAIGASQVLGFRLMENFRAPYFATSIQDFWRRWHISLSTWFKDCLYIPLGGNRCSRPRRYFNLMVTFLVSGLWHGASWNYVIWGGLHGGFQIVGDITKPWREKACQRLHIRTKPFSYRLGKVMATFFLVNFAWIFFRAPGARATLTIIRQILFGGNAASIENLGLNNTNLVVAFIAIFILIAVDFSRQHYGHLRAKLAEQNIWFRWGAYLVAIFLVLIFGVYGPTYSASQFIYFQF